MSGNNKHEQFEQVLSGNEKRVLSLALSILEDHHAAHEVAQEAFFRLWKAMSAGTVGSQCEGWLREVTLNLCRDHFQRKALFSHRTPSDPALEGVLVSEDPNASDAQEDTALIMRKLKILPEQQRMSLVLTTMKGLTCEEAGKILNCSAQAVRKYRRLALAKLRTGILSPDKSL